MDERIKRFSKRAFAKVDANGDGVISQAEWDANPPRAFDRVDANGDDLISREERENVRR